MDIGLDFVLNFKLVLYNVVCIYCKLIDLSMYYYVNLLSLYPVIFCCKLLYFEKWNAEINQTELNWTELYTLMKKLKTVYD